MNDKAQYLNNKLAMVALAGALAAAAPASSAANESVVDGSAELQMLAALVNEQLRAPPVIDGGSSIQSSSAGGGAVCGVEGHCSFTDCGCPSCPAGTVPSCACQSKGQSCEDAHNPINPFDNDKHVVFSTSCTCLKDPPPPPSDCTVHSPLTGDCILPELCETRMAVGLFGLDDRVPEWPGMALPIKPGSPPGPDPGKGC